MSQHITTTLEEFLACLDMVRAAFSVCETNRLETDEATVWKTRVQVLLKGRVVEETCKKDLLECFTFDF